MKIRQQVIFVSLLDHWQPSSQRVRRPTQIKYNFQNEIIESRSQLNFSNEIEILIKTPFVPCCCF